MKHFFESLFKPAPAEKPQEKIDDMIELSILGEKQKVPLSNLDLQVVNYIFGNVEIPVEIKIGMYGMVHHCFQTPEKAQEFLSQIKKVDTSQLSSQEREGFKKARPTETKDDPTYKGNNFYRIRLSQAQFKYFIERHGQLNTNPDELLSKHPKP